jgi:16S rRNA (adenine(1408)-N(1))-methyltransferase
MSGAEFDALAVRYARLTLDVGTGDGRFAYRYAQAHPERLIVGIDPVREAMREMSARAGRKRERGGLPNVLYVVASVERPPEELRARADELYVNLPWGSLMRGIILAEAEVLDGLASLAWEGATLRIILNTRIFDEPVPLEARDLPDVTPEYVRDELAPKYAAHNIRITEARPYDADEFGDLATTWAKRLAHRRAPRSTLVEATIGGRSRE